MSATKFLLLGPAVACLSFVCGVALADDGAATWSGTQSANAAVVQDQPSAPESVSPAVGHPIRRSPDGLFYVTARVNGVPIRFLVDTGATLVVLSPADAKRIGLAYSPAAATEHMATAAGQSAIQRVTLDQVSVVGRDLGYVDAAIVNRGLGVSLMGQNILSQLGAITFTREELQFR